MANLSQLLALMGAQGAGELPPRANLPPPGFTSGINPDPPGTVPDGTYTLPDGTVAGPEINVQAPNTRPDNPMYNLLPREEGPVQINQAPADMSDYPRVEASPQEIARSKPLEGLPEHKGLFGIKGTLRDVLGIVGDSLLMAGGRQAIYAPRREQERLSDSMAGFGSSDPNTQLAILQRVAQVNPEYAQKLAEQMQMQQYRQGQVEAQKLKAQQDALEGSQKAYKDGSAIYAQALRGMTQAGAYNPNLLAAIAKKYGLDPELYTPPPTFDKNWAEPFIRQGTTVNQQENVGLADRRQDEVERHNPVMESVAKQNAASNAQRAARPPAGRSAPQPTAASLAAEAMRIPEGKRTRDQQDLIDNFVGRNKKKGGVDSLIERAMGKKAPASGAKAPPVGYKNKHGLTFKGGDPNDRKNWK